MNRTEDAETKIWGHFDDAMNYADKAFAAADKAFAESERLASSAHQRHNCRTGTGNRNHTLRFMSHGIRERWRLTCQFLKMSWRVLYTGHTEFCFRER